MTGRWAERLFFLARRALPRRADHRRRRRLGQRGRRRCIFPPDGFSLDWYGQIFADPGWRRALDLLA